MIDIEPEVFTEVSNAVKAQFPNAKLESVTTYSPAQCPCVCIEETDNYSTQSTRDSGSNENHATVVYEVNAFSNKSTGKKKECKALIAIVDDVMNRLGFTRLTKNPINLDDATKYRIFARYTAVVSKSHIIYRR